jgi:hypothetical protein
MSSFIKVLFRIFSHILNNVANDLSKTDKIMRNNAAIHYHYIVARLLMRSLLVY